MERYGRKVVSRNMPFKLAHYKTEELSMLPTGRQINKPKKLTKRAVA